MNERIAIAFRCASGLTDEDLVDMVATMRKDAAAAAKRRKRVQNAGGTDGRELARNEAERQRRADRRKLKAAWG